MDSRFLLYEAQQAHFYGLSANLALASVTTTPATVLGLDHRIGSLKIGELSECVIDVVLRRRYAGYDAGKTVISLLTRPWPG